MTNYDDWAEIYDEIYSEYKDDLNFYQNIASDSESILEIWCGTGRISIPLAQSGKAVHGIDISTKMIEIAQIKSSLSNLTFQVMDMRELNFKQHFDTILIPFNGFQSLLTVPDQIKCLKSIKKLCHKNSKIVFDIFFPDKEIFDQKNSNYYLVSQKTQKSIEVWHKTNFDFFNQLIHTNLRVIQLLNDENPKVSYKSFTLRYCYPQELIYLFEISGLKIVNMYSDFNKTLYETNQLVIEAQII